MLLKTFPPSDIRRSGRRQFSDAAAMLRFSSTYGQSNRGRTDAQHIAVHCGEALSCPIHPLGSGAPSIRFSGILSAEIGEYLRIWLAKNVGRKIVRFFSQTREAAHPVGRFANNAIQPGLTSNCCCQTYAKNETAALL